MVIFGNINYGGASSSSDVTDQIATYVAANPLYRTFNSWAELAAAKPTKTGERVYLSSYNAVTNGSFYGSGFFVGSLAGGIADNGGVHAADSGKTYYWKREKDYKDLNVNDFGATPGGTVDAMPAIKRMFLFSQTYASTLGIQFPAGSYLISSWDYSATYVSKFRMAGPEVAFGYFPLTTLLLDGSASMAFTVQARYLEVANIAINGQYNTKANTMGFINNTVSAGAFVRVTCFYGKYVGGRCFSLLDTLDTKFDQFYTDYTYASAIYINYDNATVGNWDHSTAVEISNFNIERAYNEPAIYAPRCTQSFIYNGWIQYADYPGDLSNGQWLIDGLDMENCTNPFDLTYCQASLRGINLINTTINYANTTVTQWASGYDQGRRRDEAFGTELTGTMKARWYSGALRGTNNSSSSIWLNIGSFETNTTGGQWEIEIISRNGYSSIGTSNYAVTADRTPGKTIINVQRGAGTTPIVTMYHHGQSGVIACQYDNQSYVNILPSLWIQLIAYTGEYVVNVKSTGPTRFDAGTCNRFVLSGATQSAAPGLANTPTMRFSMHNGSAGVGAQGSYLALSSATGTPTVAAAGAAGHLAVVVNGTLRYIPYMS